VRHEWCFGDEDILPGGKQIDVGEEMGTQEAFGTIALDSVAHFFAGDKTHTV